MVINAKDFFASGVQPIQAPQEETPDKPGFFSRVKQDFNNRVVNQQQAMGREEAGQQGKLSTIFQAIGNTAGFVGDVVGEGAHSAYNALPDQIQTPITNTAQKGISKVVNSKPAQDILGSYTSWKQQHPAAAANLEASVNIASLIPIGKGGQLVGKEAQQAAKSGVKLAGQATEAALSKVKPLAQSVGNFTSRVALGDDAVKTISQSAKSPQLVKEFQSGIRNLETIAQDTSKSIQSFQTTSKEAFEKVKAALPGKPIPQPQVFEGFNHIVQGAKALTSDERRIVGSLIDEVRNWKDFTDKGILELRNIIDRSGFYRAGEEGFKNSNRVVHQVRTLFNDLVTSRNPRLKTALDTASKDIDFIERLGFNIAGSHSDSIEFAASKLSQLMNKLDDPLQKQATKSLIAELEKKTGVQIFKQLDAAKAAGVLNAPFNGFTSPLKTAGQLATRGLSEVAMKIGQIRVKGQKVPIPVNKYRVRIPGSYPKSLSK